MGKIGIKVWLYKGDILAQQQEEVEELGTIEVTLQAGDTDSERDSADEALASAGRRSASAGDAQDDPVKDTEAQDVAAEES